ncbi:helix-turn-helix domain-containing protein [Chengkuizengella axinellae]|uniref:S24 family peptidase n=1 Tax=Chengkuizengella axinellae TaxID=3064388 RepID=A0ABT9J4N8_9BACL|nr:S24 family peptidase [Chengkuizengella sp. 2205SS18-9]MDP5276560.1 S24 family peptidase [Chengkuizengella sp. 2205SS18-9]
MKLTDKLDELMKQKGISRMGLSKESGVPYTTLVNFYEKGTDNVKLSTLKKLSDYFKVSLDYLVDENIYSDAGLTKIAEFVNIPLVGRISCGDGLIAFEEVEGYRQTPKELLNGGEYFYLRAKGDSMVGARIHENDLLLIRKQSAVEHGDIAAVMINDEAVLKRVFINGDQIVLQSENDNYEPVFYSSDDVKIIGKLKMATTEF